MDTLARGAVTAWSFYADVGALLLAPFTNTSATPQSDEDDDQEQEQEDTEEGQEDEEVETDAWTAELAKLQEVARHTLVVDPSQQDDYAAAQLNLFQLMVSMGIIEFTTQGYLFKLEQRVDVTPLVTTPAADAFKSSDPQTDLSANTEQ